MEKRTIKIFISSPGDVLYERQIAKRIIAKLGKEFAASVKLEALLWEDMPLQVTSSFQEGIDQIAKADIVDIAIFILWSRLGTPLSDKYVKPDGSFYKSGTEYEFEMMYAANLQSGAPSILAYVKNAPITDAIFQSQASAGFDFEEIGKQHKETQRFIREKFYDPDTKTVYGAYHQFEAPTTFEQKLTEHLRRLIINKMGHEAVIAEWEGNPYVGLRSFTYEENAIFYGRRHTINSIEEKFARYLPDKAPCLFVLGESGSGKSSLVRAGLLPDMIEFGWVDNTKWKWFDMTPGQFRGNIYNGIVSKLIEAFPALKEKTIGKDLMAGNEINFGHLSDILPEKTDKSVLFFIDQFEEVFTDPLITEQERIRSLVLLSGIASTHKVWLIFSMRSDFYHKFTSYPVLSELKNNSIVYDLPKILYSELQEIIEEPAKKAGLKWETNEHGIPLNRTIIHDISSGVDDLPLIEFALSELYNLRDENNVLTYKAYEEIGKIDGAVVKYVDNFYNTLSEKEKELFCQILSALITPSPENKNLCVRKTALFKDLQKTEQHRQLLDSLINSHLLISGKDENGEATVSIVHEILISKWNVIQDWIKQEKYFIDANNHYENLSKYWTEHKKSKDDLLQGNIAVKESEYFLYAWENNSSENAKDFLFTSIKQKRRQFLPATLIALLVAAIIGVVKGFKLLSSDETTWSMEGMLLYLIPTVMLVYVAWKKRKAVPNYRTIHVSLIIWTVLSVLSVALLFVSHDLHDSEEYYVLPVFVLLKLVDTIIKKREILQWKQRIFKRGFSYLSGFLDTSSKFFQKTLKVFIGIISFILLAVVVAGVYLIFQFDDMKDDIVDKTTTITDDLFDRLHQISSTLPEGDRIYFNRKHLEYLHNNFEDELTDDDANIRKHQYALVQYNLGYPEGSPEKVGKSLNLHSPQNLKTTIIAACELGLFDDCRKLIDEYKKSLENTKDYVPDEFDQKVIWTAEKLGLFESVTEMFNYPWNMDNDGVMVIYKAHALLMTGETEKALSLYRRQINDISFDCKNQIKKDFAVFRWSGLPHDRISIIENELHLDKIRVYTHPEDDTNTTAMAAPFTGKWQYEENDRRIQWEITEDSYHLCRYLMQTKGNGQDEWVDDEVIVTRYRFKQKEDKIIIEEYNVRTNIISVAEIEQITDNELQIKAIENGNSVYRQEIRRYKR